MGGGPVTSGRRHVGDPARGPRVAPTEPTQRQPPAAERTVAFDGDQGVLRTARVEPARGGRHRRDDQLVGPDEQHQGTTGRATQHLDRRHRDRTAPRSRSLRSTVPSADRRSEESVSKSAEPAGGRARTTMSTPAGSESRIWITNPRSRRRTVLRTTAPPTAFDTTKPTWASDGAVSLPTSLSRGRQCTTTVVRPARTPPRIVRGKSPARRIRSGAGSTGQAESSARPLRRRPARIARPARVRIRSRKPWVLARRRLFGWKVRLDTDTPQVDQVTAGRRKQETLGGSVPRRRTSPSENLRKACGHADMSRQERLCHGTRQRASGQTPRDHPLPGTPEYREPPIIAGTGPMSWATRRAWGTGSAQTGDFSFPEAAIAPRDFLPTTCGQTCGPCRDA